MDEYAGRVLANRYRLPVLAADAYEFAAETRAFDTYSGQEVLVRQVPLPEVVEAEVLDADGLPEGFRPGGDGGRGGVEPSPSSQLRASGGGPIVARAVEAAQAAARIPDHPRLDQVFDVFAEGGSLWVVSEWVAARPLAALLERGPLSPYRAAEVAADVLTALRVLHAHGWVHRNVTARTVLVCDDGRVMLTGLAVGAVEEALCGYDVVPVPPEEDREVVAEVEEPVVEAGDYRAARAGAIAAYRENATGGVPAARWSEVVGGSDVAGLRPGPRSSSAGGAVIGGGGGGDGGVGGGDVAGLRPGPRASNAGGAGIGPAGVGIGSGEAGIGPARAGIGPGEAGIGSGRVGIGAGGAGTGPTGVGIGSGGAGIGPTGAGIGSGGAGIGSGGAGIGVGEAGIGVGGARSAERARQVRMTVVGPVTERWAPEQAYPVQENWQLAAPVGPATDLWALGALLFRAVQGHAPYPEESTPELVQMVCAEPPAFAEECGPVRPVVESLLRQDPTERLDIEELRGWLRSLVRSAPEPEAGVNVVAAPAFDAGRLPVVRRKGELVRKRRGRAPGGAAHGRHKRERAVQRAPRAPRAPRERRPRSLGRWLLVLVLLGLVGAVAYAMVFMPKADQGAAGAGAAGAAPSASSEGRRGESAKEPRESRESKEPSGGVTSAEGGRSSKPSSTKPQSDVAPGFVLREDDAGFEVAVAKGWQREGKNGRGQVVYAHGAFELIVVPGRDSTATYGKDPMKYQREHERELQPFRDSTWATSSGMKSVDVGGRVMAEGQFTWQGADGSEVYVRNLAMVVGGKYHVVQVRGPEAERDEVSRLYQQAYSTYRVGG
ncbi:MULTISPECIES: protein kinase [unclassified Streptomyces]|uniref:protein kinase n=1 Tax=unclassified Streptomyces TaxID=2593676 RepID=UPI00278C2BF2|nr:MULTISPECIES: protein kinase [unclassified Streptomyces]